MIKMKLESSNFKFSPIQEKNIKKAFKYIIKDAQNKKVDPKVSKKEGSC